MVGGLAVIFGLSGVPVLDAPAEFPLTALASDDGTGVVPDVPVLAPVSAAGSLTAGLELDAGLPCPPTLGSAKAGAAENRMAAAMMAVLCIVVPLFVVPSTNTRDGRAFHHFNGLRVIAWSAPGDANPARERRGERSG